VAALAAAGGRVEQVGQWKHQDLGHFGGGGAPDGIGADTGEDRGDVKAGRGPDCGEAAEDGRGGGVQGDFFVGFAQGGGFGAGVASVDAAAGEADLVGVMAQEG
jgi:hypothetical protein